MKKATVEAAYQLLDKLNISYTRVDHEAISSVKNYDVVLPGPQVKNLLLKTKKGKDYYFVIVDENKQVDLKYLAQMLDSKRLSFASTEELNDLLGLEPGMLTPLALPYDEKHRIKLVIDSDIDHAKTVGFHPNVNTTTLMIQFSDFERFLDTYGYQPIYIALSTEPPNKQ